MAVEDPEPADESRTALTGAVDPDARSPGDATAAVAEKKKRKVRKKRRRRVTPAGIIARSLGSPPPASGTTRSKTLTAAQVLARSLESHAERTRPLPAEPINGDAASAVAPDGIPQTTDGPDRDRRNGVDSRFWELWCEHETFLLKQGLRFMAGNLADAEDALSVAKLNGSIAFAEEPILNARAWLTRLVYNACMDQYRSRRRQTAWVDEVSAREQELSSLPGGNGSGQRPDDHLFNCERLNALERDLLALPVGLLEPFLMRFIEDMTYVEIADRLGLTNAAVRKRIQLAREKLRKLD